MKAFLRIQTYKEEETVSDIERYTSHSQPGPTYGPYGTSAVKHVVHGSARWWLCKGCMADYSHTRYPLHEPASYGGQ